MTRLDVPSPAPTQATDGLAQDTALLSNALNSVLEEQAGRVFASRLQWLFKTAAAVRAGDEAAAERLVAYLRGVPDESVEPIIRACSLELQLANIAEERERARRRRQYDRTGEVQRESLAETAQILRDRQIDISPLMAQLQIEHVLTAHPTEATRRSVLDHQWDVALLLDKLDDPRTGHSRRRQLLERAARGADDLVADGRAAPDPAQGRGRGPPQPLLLRGRALRRHPVRAGRDRARAGRPARPAGPELRLLDGRRHGRPPRGRGRHARERAHAAPEHRAAAAAGARGQARTGVQPLLAARTGVPGARGLARPGRRGAAERGRAPPPAPRVGAAAHEARLRLPPARQHAHPARSRARVRGRAGAAARPRAGARPRQLPPRRDRRDPPAAVAGRRVRLPPRRRRHPPGRGRGARRDRRGAARASPTPTTRRAGSRCSPRRWPPAGAASSTTRAARPASCCARWTRSR